MSKISLNNIIISKPKKIDNTYVCNIYYPVKKEYLELSFDNVLLLSVKPLKHRNEFTIDFKNKLYNNFICDLNDFIIQTVKEKSPVWFDNNMNTDLIADYYTNPLIYDKKHGDIIRFKCVGNEDYIKSIINKKINIKLQFNYIRFYRQKFLIECEILTIEENNKYLIADEDTESDYENPEPTIDDINIIKTECLHNVTNYLTELKNKINMLETFQEKLLNTYDIGNIINICDELEKLCE